MKIGVNGRTFSVSEPDGAVQTSRRLAIGLSELENQVTVFGSQQMELSAKSLTRHSTGYPIRSQAYGTVWERTVLPVLLKQQSLDVFYAPNGNGPLHTVDVPVVMCIHDVNAQLGMSSMIHQLYRKSTVPRAANAADLITTVSEFSKDEICETFPIPESKVRVVHNGIDEFFLENGGSEPIAVPDDYILFVGAMNPRKNISRMVEAFTQLKSDHDIPHTLVLVGPKNLDIYKDVDIEKSKHIIHLGYLSIKELKYVYERADCFLYPSLYEGFGIPPLEAMACGTPVVGSNAGALPEILADAAELPDPTDVDAIADAILTVLENMNRRDTLIQRGTERSREFIWEQSIRDLNRICEEAANSA